MKVKYIANEMICGCPTHPGELIQDELTARGLSQLQLAKEIDVTPSFLNEIIKGKRSLNTELALLLEAALEIPAHIWLGLQADYNMQTVKSNPTFMSRLANVRRIAAVL